MADQNAPTSKDTAPSLVSSQGLSTHKRTWSEASTSSSQRSPSAAPRKLLNHLDHPTLLHQALQDSDITPPPPPLLPRLESSLSSLSSSDSRRERRLMLCIESGHLPRVCSTYSPHGDITMPRVNSTMSPNGGMALQRLDSMSPSSSPLWRTLPHASSISSPHPSPSHTTDFPSSPLLSHRLSAGHVAGPRAVSPGVTPSTATPLLRFPSKLGRHSDEPEPLLPVWNDLDKVTAGTTIFHNQAGPGKVGPELCPSSKTRIHNSRSLNMESLFKDGALTRPIAEANHGGEEERSTSGDDMEEDEPSGYSFKIELGAEVFPHSPDLNANRSKVLGSRHGTPMRRKSADFLGF